MLLPQYSIRKLLIVTALCAVFCVVLAAAFRGQAWAIGVSAAVASLFLLLLMHAAFNVIAWWLSTLVELALPRDRRQSPFADGSLPPQLVTPQQDSEQN